MYYATVDVEIDKEPGSLTVVLSLETGAAQDWAAQYWGEPIAWPPTYILQAKEAVSAIANAIDAGLEVR